MPPAFFHDYLRKSLLVCGSILLIFTPVFAETLRPDSALLDTVWIQGKAQKLSSLNRENLRGGHWKITRNNFKTTQNNVADVLRAAPGVSLTQTGDVLAPTRIRIRGSQSDQVLILLDGSPLNAPLPHAALARSEQRTGVDLSSISLNRVESITVIRGAASAEYGAGAVAGVILIQSRNTLTSELQLEAGIGSSGFRNISGSWNTPIGEESSLAIQAGHQESQGRYVYYDPERTQGDACNQDQGGQLYLRQCNQSQQDQFSFNWKQNSTRKWSGNWQRLQRHGLGGTQNFRPHGQSTEEQRLLQVQEDWNLNESLDSGIRANVTQVLGTRSDNTQASSGVLDTQFQELRYNADAWMEFWWKDQPLRMGSSMTQTQLEDRNFRKERLQTSGYSKFSLDAFKAPFSQIKTPSKVEIALRYDHSSDLSSQGTYKFDVTQYGAKHWGAKLGQGTGYRLPTLYELYDPGNLELWGQSAANPNLLSERSLSRHFGLFYDNKEQEFPSFYAEVMFFELTVQDQILVLANPLAPSQFRFENIKRTRSQGIESLLNTRFTEYWSLDFSGTQMQAKIVENSALDKRDNGKQIPGTPARQWNLSVSWDSGDWGASLGTRFSEKRYVDTANTRFLKSYQVSDLGFNFPVFIESLRGKFSIKNLENVSYAEQENFPPPGRQWRFTLLWKKKMGGNVSSTKNKRQKF